jgi:hypothetical protein
VKELEAPPAESVRWLGTLHDGRTVVVEAKLWYTARDLVCQHFGVGLSEVLDVHLAPPETPGSCENGGGI